MNTTKDFLKAVKAKTGAVSDYALAKTLHTSKQVISGYMVKDYILSDEIALKVASILEIDPVLVVAAIHEERAKTPTEKAMWHNIFERLGGVAAALVVGVGISATPAPVQANSGATSYNNQQGNVYYVSHRLCST